MTRIDGTVSGDWHDEMLNSALIESLKTHLDVSKVRLVEVDAHINDPEFADIPERIKDGQVVVDLVRVTENTSDKVQYDGICW